MSTTKKRPPLPRSVAMELFDKDGASYKTRKAAALRRKMLQNKSKK